MVNIDVVKAVVEKNAELLVEDIASSTSISQGGVQIRLKSILYLRKRIEGHKKHLKCSQYFLKNKTKTVLVR